MQTQTCFLPALPRGVCAPLPPWHSALTAALLWVRSTPPSTSASTRESSWTWEVQSLCSLRRPPRLSRCHSATRSKSRSNRSAAFAHCQTRAWCLQETWRSLFERWGPCLSQDSWSCQRSSLEKTNGWTCRPHSGTCWWSTCAWWTRRPRQGRWSPAWPWWRAARGHASGSGFRLCILTRLRGRLNFHFGSSWIKWAQIDRALLGDGTSGFGVPSFRGTRHARATDRSCLEVRLRRSWLWGAAIQSRGALTYTQVRWGTRSLRLGSRLNLILTAASGSLSAVYTVFSCRQFCRDPWMRVLCWCPRCYCVWVRGLSRNGRSHRQGAQLSCACCCRAELLCISWEPMHTRPIARCPPWGRRRYRAVSQYPHRQCGSYKVREYRPPELRECRHIRLRQTFDTIRENWCQMARLCFLLLKANCRLKTAA